MGQKYYQQKEVAELAGVLSITVARGCDSGKLPSPDVRVGCRMFFSEDAKDTIVCYFKNRKYAR